MADAKVLKRGLKLIEELARSAEGMTVAELADAMKIHKASVYRYLNTLLDMGYVECSTKGRYRVGMGVVALGSRQLMNMSARETAHPYLLDLSAATHKTVHMCVLDGMEVIYIDKIEGQRTLPVISRIGSRAPAHCTAVGKALLSSMEIERVVSSVRANTLKRYTSNTITDPLEFLEEIKRVAERGYAIDNGEHEEGIMCTAAVVRAYGGEVVGAISITGLQREFDGAELSKRMIAATVQGAERISNALGYVGERGDGTRVEPLRGTDDAALG